MEEVVEQLNIDPTTPVGHCSCCRREIGEDDERLTMDVVWEDALLSLSICRFCIAEHAPNLLEELESA